MDPSVHYFMYAEKMLCFVGLWHNQTHRQRLLRYYVIGFMSLYCVLSQICQLYTSNFDLGSAVRLLQLFVSSVSGAAMYYPCIFHYKTLTKIYSFILHDLQRLNDNTELKIVQTYVHYGNVITIFSFVLIYAHLIMNVSSSLLRMILSTNAIRSDLDLFPIISCFDYLSNRETYYYPIIIYQTITNFALITASSSCYINLLIVILHACARLSIIKYKIYSSFSRIIHKDDALAKPIDFSPWIIDIVKSLIRTTEFMTLVNAVFEKNYLFQITLGFFLLILDFLCIPILLEHKIAVKDILMFSIYIFGIIFVVYINCYIGQVLMDYSSNVYREACLIPFYQMSLKTQKILLITLAMAAKPYTVSIGKVYVASHEFFGNFLRSSLSFAMVIHSMQNV